MSTRFLKPMAAAVLGALVVASIDAGTAAQDPPIKLVAPGGQPPQPDPDENAAPDGTEVLAKGPVHEAFATTAEAPEPEPVVAKQPPEPIEELPPDQRPEGENVQWISGYWDWDEEAERFLWVSGCWRDTPPGHVWVPGSWREATGGWQWVSGFWQEPSRDEPTQPELTYLPEPQESLEVGPSVAAPTATSFYVPGSWVWRAKYVWRPGVWVEYRPNWVWVPAHFRWTPLGYIFVEGYWDYTLASRGVLFAPVAFARPVRPAFVYTPAYVVSEQCLVGALFVRRGRPQYYFGDYFEPRYVNRGFNPWAGRVSGVTFTVGFGTGRTWGYDPLWAHYSVARRTDRDWNTRVNTLYTGRYAGKVARPPATLVQQNTAINKITNVNVTNVTNNITVNNVDNSRQVTVNNKNVTDVAMIAPLKVAKNLQPEARIQQVTAEVRRAEAQTAKQTREVGVQRTKLETAAVAKLPPAPKANPKQPGGKNPAPQPVAVQQVQTLKIELPKAAVTRAQIKDEKKAPPPPAVKAEAAPKVDPKGGTPKIDPRPDPKPKVDPMPKVDPRPDPKPKDPRPDPKPKVDPRPDPKVEPKPKGDPKPKDPIPDPKPKVDPKPKDPPVPVPMPKSEPKPKDPVPVPKGEPKKDPTPVPVPKGEPKKDPRPDPIPKVEPKPKFDPPPVPKPKPKDPTPDPKPKFEPPAPMPKFDPPRPKEPAPAPKPKDPSPLPPVPKGEPKKDPTPPAPVPVPKPKDPPAPPAPKGPVIPPAPPAPKGEPKDPAPPPKKGGGEPKKKDRDPA